MMRYDNLVMPDKAKKAAQTLKQYCEQNGCMYCVFYQNEHCALNCEPRKYNLPPRSMGGLEHA